MRIRDWSSDVCSSDLDDAPQLAVDIDQDKAGALGLDLGAINSEISSAWGSAYVNDFLDRGRTKRVYIQADEAYRSSPEGIENLSVRGTSGEMAPIRAFSPLPGKNATVILSPHTGNTALTLPGAPGQRLRPG